MVRKAVPFYREDLEAMYDTIFSQWDQKIIDWSELRALVRALVIYYSFCRGSDFAYLQDFHVSDHLTYIKLTFPKSKNDQYYENSTSFNPAINTKYCPVALIRFYFSH